MDVEGLYFLNSIPETLGEEETIELIKRMGDGDEDARDELILGYSRLVISIARKHEGWLMEFEDAVSNGFIGLLKAVRSYDPSLGYKFMTYAHVAIDRYLYRCVRREILHRGNLQALSIDVELAEAEGETLKDFIEDPVNNVNEYIDNSIRKTEVAKCLEKLTDKEREYVFLKYGLDGGGLRKDCDVAKMMGVSKQRVCNLHRTAFRKMEGTML